MATAKYPEDRNTDKISGITADLPTKYKSIADMKDIDSKKSTLRRWIDDAVTYYDTNLKERWNYYANLYNCIREKPEGVASWRSNIFIPLAWQGVQDTAPHALDALIGNGNFYSIAPVKPDEDTIEKAKAWEKLLSWHLNQGKLYTHSYNAYTYAGQFQVGWVKMTWEIREQVKEYYDLRDGKIKEVKERSIEKDGLKFEAYDPRRVYPDPYCENIDDMRYLCEYSYVTRADLEAMEEKHGANKKEIKDFLTYAESKDEWERYRLYTVYTRRGIYKIIEDDQSGCYLVQEMGNPYKHGHIPFYPMVIYPVGGQLYGRSIVEMLADYNEYANDVQNLKADNLMLSVNKIMVMKEDATLDPISLRIEPGSIVPLRNGKEDLQVMDLGNVHNEVFTELENIMGMANRLIGSASGITSPDGIEGVNNKTATGAKILAYESAKQTNMFVKFNRENFLIPLLRDAIEMIEQYGTDDNEVLEKQIGSLSEYIQTEGDTEDVLTAFDIVLSGETGFVGKQAAIEKIQVFLSLIQTMPEVVGLVNQEAIAKNLVQLLELPDNVMKEGVEAGEDIDLNAYTAEEQAQLKQFADSKGLPIEQVLKQINAGESLEQINAQTGAEMYGAENEQQV